MLPYNKSNIPLAKNLRKNMTPWERKLWYEFLNSYPVRFQRQKSIGNYIVDFYCAKARLVIELDGSQHFDPKGIKKDAIRTAFLEEYGIMVLRIQNDEIFDNFDMICDYIDSLVKRRMAGDKGSLV
ncbi:MAG: endonuclease domain-containing protein [Clostridia bacterium]|nr:endonuclease domain-containing protein [Clostridia bacterium]